MATKAQRIEYEALNQEIARLRREGDDLVKRRRALHKEMYPPKTYSAPERAKAALKALEAWEDEYELADHCYFCGELRGCCQEDVCAWVEVIDRLEEDAKRGD